MCVFIQIYHLNYQQRGGGGGGGGGSIDLDVLQ